MTNRLPRYDTSQSYEWNYQHAPDVVPDVDVPQVAGNWTFCGLPVASPLGIAAGPLLNGRWLLYYAALGFDVLTYKTVRSRARECYSLPNLQPVDSTELKAAGRTIAASAEMHGSWAVSFGMPSRSPDVWRADVEWTKQQLPKGKLLSVSVVGTTQPGWSLDDLADDFAQCARWAVESGADCVETNFSCPNVSTCDGQLYQQPAAAALVAQRVREAIGKTPLCIKVGFVHEAAAADELITAIAPFAAALSMTNCIAATVRGADDAPLFGGEPRGIGGDAIRAASVNQVRLFAAAAQRLHSSLRLIGVGGISTVEHVSEYLAAGAEAVHLATAVMTNPLAAIEIKRALPDADPHQAMSDNSASKSTGFTR